jgi:hypothetical protein
MEDPTKPERLPWWREWLRITRRIARKIIGYVALPFRWLAQAIYIGAAVLFVPFIIVYFATATPKDKAYRNLHPLANPICSKGLSEPWTILANVNSKRAGAGAIDEDGWIDPSNSETDAVKTDPDWMQRLHCSLQYHEIPLVGSAVSDVREPLRYHLGFLEFRESGEPYSLVLEGDRDVSVDDVKRLKGTSKRYPITQLDVLRNHLATGSHYVIVFVHGWRHDASIGDQNVADLRHYAAHAARYLVERCADERRNYIPAIHCDMEVTAIYVGWRGARVDEATMRKSPGVLGVLGAYFGQIAAAGTLFDRKPVSEQIAPVALSALRSIELELSPRDIGGHLKSNPQKNKMIVIGHSLGGNLLMTGLHDSVIKAVRLHKPTEVMPPVLGDLVVLINPAAEAEKWTAIQREVWNRLAYQWTPVTPLDAIVASHRFFPPEQPPVLLSVTSSFGFPPGGVQDGDCAAIRARGRSEILERINSHTGEYEQVGVYDWATHDLFPTFKMDFRPLADYLQRTADSIEGRPPQGTTCGGEPFTPKWHLHIASLVPHALSVLFATLPFQNTDRESSHTIGHLDPPRAGPGLFTDGLGSWAPFGTTHEMRRVGEQNSPELPETREQHNAYAAIPNAAITCPRPTYWLQHARRAKPNGTFWDSSELTDPLDPNPAEEGPAAKFHHGFSLSGLIPPTRANDPFWNIRVDNSLISKHDGYRLSSFICAINQFVMDEITIGSDVKPADDGKGTQVWKAVPSATGRASAGN